MDTATFDLALSEGIRTRLQGAGISVNAAAERTGIPYATLWRHLNRGGLDIRETHALAELLKTSVSDLTALAVTA